MSETTLFKTTLFEGCLKKNLLYIFLRFRFHTLKAIAQYSPKTETDIIWRGGKEGNKNG